MFYLFQVFAFSSSSFFKVSLCITSVFQWIQDKHLLSIVMCTKFLESKSNALFVLVHDWKYDTLRALVASIVCIQIQVELTKICVLHWNHWFFIEFHTMTKEMLNITCQLTVCRAQTTSVTTYQLKGYSTFVCHCLLKDLLYDFFCGNTSNSLFFFYIDAVIKSVCSVILV